MPLMNKSNKIKDLLELYWSFFKIGGLTFGGGLTMLPMLERELVEKKGWTTSEELLDVYAIGQCTPGIIAVNTATFIGYKKGKVLGSIFATLGMISPSIIIILILANFLKVLAGNAYYQHAMLGVRAVVCGLLANTVITLGKKSLKKVHAWLIFAVILALALFTKTPTVVLVLGIAAYGIAFDIICTKIKNKKEKKADINEATEGEAKND